MEAPSKKPSRFLYQPMSMTATDWLVDCVICAGAFGFGVIQLTLSANLFIPDAFTRMILGIKTITPSSPEMLATFLTCLPLIVRRRFPWPTFIVSLMMWMAFDWGMGFQSLSMISPLVALFTLSYERGRSEAFAAGAITLVVMMLSVLFGSSSSLASLLLFQNITLAVAVTLGGYALNAHRQVAAEAEAHAQEAERSRESLARQRVEEERVRIAREIHDITAHSLSAVSIQAAAAERLIRIDFDAAESAVAQIRSIAKSSLDDMRAMVGLLRGDDAKETAPVGGTDRMGDLVDFLEDADIACDLSMSTYDRGGVPAHVDIALFGIAREACTNIVRHSQAEHASIRLGCEEDGAVLEIVDDGRGLPSEAPTSGHGLEGMRERALLLGGAFRAQRSECGGTKITVSIPLAPST